MCVAHRGRGNAKVGEEHQAVRSADGSDIVRPCRRQAINLAFAEPRPARQMNMAPSVTSAKNHEEVNVGRLKPIAGEDECRELSHPKGQHRCEGASKRSNCSCI